MEEELLPKPLTDLPLPEKDLPLPEKEIPANLASKGDAFRSYKRLPLILLIPVVLVILFVLVGGAYFLGKNSANKQVETPSGSPEPTAQTPTPTPDPTADWKTISTGTFSIKIPINWFIESNRDNYLRVQNYNPEGAPGRGFDPIQDKGWFAVQIGKLDKKAINTQQLKTVLSELDAESKSAGFSENPTTYSETNLNGISGIKRNSIESPQEPPIVYLLDGKGGVFFFTPSLDLSVERENYEKILSTFRFD